MGTLNDCAEVYKHLIILFLLWLLSAGCGLYVNTQFFRLIIIPLVFCLWIMSSRVPLSPIDEERRNFLATQYFQDEFNYIDKPSCSSAPDRIPDNLDPGKYFHVILIGSLGVINLA